MSKVDIYGKEKKLEWSLKQIREDPAIVEEARKEILGFVDYCTATGLSTYRILFYLDRLRPIAKKLGKSFKEANKEDLEAFLAWLERAEKHNPRKNAAQEPKQYLSAETKNIYRTTLKKFYKWLEGNGETFPPKVAWIKKVKSNGRILPEGLLDEEDLKKMIDAATNPRDKALLACLAESGCRITELASLRLKDITFDENGAVLIVDGKTGMRRVRLISSVHYLVSWMENHPDKKNPEAFLWVMLTSKDKGKACMKYPTLRTRIIKIAKKAGITKRVNLHGFRHKRGTQLANMGLTSAQVSVCLGHSAQMAERYIHLSGKDTDNALFRASGMQTETKNPALLECPRCRKANTPDASFCKGCGLPLTLSTSEVFQKDRDKEEFIRKVQPLMELLENPDVQKYIAQKMAENSPRQVSAGT